MFVLSEGRLEYRLPCNCGTGVLRNTRFASPSCGMKGPESTGVDALFEDGLPSSCEYVKGGEWACEVALWATRVDLSSAFVALDRSELVIIRAEDFGRTVARHSRTAQQVAQYASVFTEYATVL